MFVHLPYSFLLVYVLSFCSIINILKDLRLRIKVVFFSSLSAMLYHIVFVSDYLIKYPQPVDTFI